MDEIIALEKQREVSRLGQGVGEAVAHIEISKMARSTTITRVGKPCDFKLRQIKRNYRQLKTVDKHLELASVDATA